MKARLPRDSFTSKSEWTCKRTCERMDWNKLCRVGVTRKGTRTMSSSKMDKTRQAWIQVQNSHSRSRSAVDSAAHTLQTSRTLHKELCVHRDMCSVQPGSGSPRWCCKVPRRTQCSGVLPKISLAIRLGRGKNVSSGGQRAPNPKHSPTCVW